MRPLAAALIVALCLVVAGCGGGGTHAAQRGAPGQARSARADPVVSAAQAAVRANLAFYAGYDGPASGPRRKPDQLVVFVAGDITNGGIAGVAQGVAEAARAIGWRLRILDGQASVAGRTAALKAALRMRPDGIILGGFDATEQRTEMMRAKALHIPVVGWHSGTQPGPDPAAGLFTNVSTNPVTVAQLAADYVIAESDGRAGVAIFYDSEFQIAVLKAEVMRRAIERCKRCSVLAMENVPISDAQDLTPALVAELVRRYGARLTYLLAINGNYFAGSAAGLFALGIGGSAPPFAVAAGDGDEAEFARIRAGDYQTASVAEPLYLQGWQLIDELNRAILHRPASGYVPPPHLIIRSDVPSGAVFDPPTPYRRRYERLWGV